MRRGFEDQFGCQLTAAKLDDFGVGIGVFGIANSCTHQHLAKREDAADHQAFALYGFDQAIMGCTEIAGTDLGGMCVAMDRPDRLINKRKTRKKRDAPEGVPNRCVETI